MFAQCKAFARPVVLFFTLALIFTTSQPGNAATINIKLSGSMPTFGDVTEFAISPDGQWVVFIADKLIDEMMELYSAPITGGEPIRLNRALPNGGSVESFTISPDSQWVVYIANQSHVNTLDLYSVPIGGGDTVRLNGTIRTGGDVHSMAISPNSQRVVYLSDQEVLNQNELYSVPIDRSASPVKLNDPLPEDLKISYEFAITSNNQRVVYVVENFTVQAELWSNNLAGGSPVKIKQPVGSYIDDFKITQNGLGVVYRGRTPGITHWDLYSAATNGTGVFYTLSAVPPANIGVTKYEITPNSLAVIYKADQDHIYTSELYLNSIVGGTPHQINPDFPTDDDYVGCFEVASNSLGVVWTHVDPDTIAEIYASTFDGADPVKLNGVLPEGSSVAACAFKITPNSAGVVYMIEEAEWPKPIKEIYSYIAGGTPTRLGGSLDSDQAFWNKFAIAPNSLGVVFLNWNHYVDELYATSIFGGTPEKINNPIDPWSLTVDDFAVTPDSKGVVYLSDQDVGNCSELYLAVQARQIFLPNVIR